MLPARVGAASDQANVAVNREEVDPEDGSVWVGRNPDGPTDRAVDVLRIDDVQGNAIATVVSYAAHPVVIGYTRYLCSQDYPGVVRRVVEGATGAIVQDDWGELERMGGRIGGAAVNAFHQIETRPHVEIRKRGKSLSLVAFYHKEFHEGPTHQILRAAQGVAKVKLQPLPSLETAQAQVAQEQAVLQKLIEAGESTETTVPQSLNVRWAEGVLEKVKAGDVEHTLEYPLVGFRIDDFVLLGMPGEPFVEVQIGAKQRSQSKHTMFAGYANGIQAYIPVAQTVRQGGMAVSSAVRTYNIPAPPVESSVDDVLSALGELLEELGV